MWVTDWSMIDERSQYIVCQVNARPDGGLYLALPVIRLGWQVKRLLEGAYVALPMPPFDAPTKRKEGVRG